MICDAIRDDIDLYALGTLLPDEAARVGAHASSCPDCRALLRDAEDLVARLAASVSLVRAPASLRAAVMGAVRQPGGGTAPAAPRSRRRLIATLRPRWNVRRSAAVAAIALVVPLAGMAVWVARLQREVNTLRADTVEIRQRNDGLLLLAMPSSVRADLQPTGDATGAGGTVSWNPARGICWLLVDGLPRAEPGTAYRVWYVVDGQRVIDAGVIQPDEAGKAQLAIDASRWRGQQYDIVVRQERRPRDQNAPILLTARLQRP